MKYNFDEIINRKNTNSLKYDFAVERGKPANVLPLWVADMDVMAAPEIIAAITAGCQHGIFGYSDVKRDYFLTIAKWLDESFSWKVQEDWLVKAPGVVFSIAMAIRAFTKPGDSILIQRPVYYPFSLTIEDNNRRLVNSPLVYKNSHYEMDYTDFEEKIIQNNVKLFILCSPHNPVGRVWTKAELIRIGDICVKHDVLIIADEIHHEFVYTGHTHHVFADLKPEYLNRTITCTAPSKTFNLAGLQISHIFIADQTLRKKFQKEIDKTGYCELNSLGLIAAKAAYEHGRDWLNQLKVYLTENLQFSRDFIAKELPGVRLVEPEGTYLIWLDFSELGLSPEELDQKIIYKAGLWLDRGPMFGPEGTNFQRINIACPRSTLKQALLNLKSILD